MSVLSQHRVIRIAFGLWGMARPSQLLAFIVLYLTGVIIAVKQGHSMTFVQGLAGLIPLLIAGASIHYSNEYADVETDKLTRRTPFSGGSGVLADGLISRRMAWWGMWILLSLALAKATICAVIMQVTPVACGILCIGLFFGWMYSVAPLKLAWRGWGELDNALLGGMLLALYGYANVTNEVTPEIVLMFLPFTGMVFINLLATTYADRYADNVVGKHTLATRFENNTLRRLYALVALLSYGLLIALTDRIIPLEIVIGGLCVSPLVLWGYIRYTRMHSPHPTVIAMVAMMLVYFIGWLIV